MGDSGVDMEQGDSSARDSRLSPLNPKDMAAFVNKKIYELLQEKIPDMIELDKENDVVRAAQLKRYSDASKLQDNARDIKSVIIGGIDCLPIPEENETINADFIADAVIKALIAEFGPKEVPPAPTSEELQQLEYAFTKIKYIGNAHVKFGQYLRRCYQAYKNHSNEFKSPYVMVAQSSGFGKSRMIRELAVMANDDKDLDMKVLYTCIRLPNSTGYPKATPVLSRWLLEIEPTVDGIAKRLKAIFHCATEHWDTVQTQWLGLFTDTATAAAVTEALEKTLKRQEAKATEKTAFNKEERSDKLVLVIIDEARNLIDNTTSGLDHFHLLERALVLANYGIGKEGRIFAVLVDTNPRLTIRDPLPPPHKVDPSSRGCYSTRNASSFPPFVLTHTMDAFWQQYCRDQLEKAQGVEKGEEDREGGDGLGTTGTAIQEKENWIPMSDQIAMYKRIAAGSENEAWEALSRMGRPLWHTSNLRKRQLLTFAANKLMLGVGPWRESHHSVHTMFGVASMLCRLGVRPYSTSALAPLVVANFMATLAYVNYERDGFLSSYASDPVLSFGAAKVWYELENGLAKYILPQLKKLIANEALDTGGAGELVACTVLLLAMDKCAMNSYGRLDDELIGQLVPVKKFLALLGVGEMPVYQKGEKTPSDIGRRAFYEWVLEWQDWCVGFTHFVQLVDEPDDNTLWYLLGRRAAGVSPRGQPGAYLLIPIVKRVTKGDLNEKIGNEEVSYVLVQVENWSSGDSEFPQAVTKELSPEIVFKAAGNPLSGKTVDEVIRIYMNVGEKANGPSRFIFASPLADNLPDTHFISSVTSETGSDSSDAESWCGSNAQDTGKPKRSMSGVKEKTSQVETAFLMCFRSVDCTTFPFLKEGVAASLASFVGSSWPLATLVDDDLDHRDCAGDRLASVMPRDELHEIALRGLAKAPGREERTVNECKKCLESTPGCKKIKRHQHR